MPIFYITMPDTDIEKCRIELTKRQQNGGHEMPTKNLVNADLEWIERRIPGIKSGPTPPNFYPQKFEDNLLGYLNKDKQVETNEVDEALKKGPRLCWVWNSIDNRYMEIVTRKQSVHNWHRYITESGAMFERAELVKREEIEKYLGDK